MWISSLTIYGFGAAWGLSGAGSCLPFTIINPIVRQFHLFEVFSFNWIEICPFISYQIICLIHSLANCFEKNPFACPSAHACAHTHTHSFAWRAFYETALTVSLLPLDWFHDPPVGGSLQYEKCLSSPSSPRQAFKGVMTALLAPQSFLVPGVTLLPLAVVQLPHCPGQSHALGGLQCVESSANERPRSEARALQVAGQFRVEEGLLSFARHHF